MTITPHTFGRGSAAPGNPQHDAGRSAELSVNQSRRMRGVIFVSAICGSAFTLFGFSGLLAIATAFAEPRHSAWPFIHAALFWFATTVFLLLYACGMAGRILRYLYDSELIIASQDLGLQELNADNAWLLACHRHRHAGAGEPVGGNVVSIHRH